MIGGDILSSASSSHTDATLMNLFFKEGKIDQAIKLLGNMTSMGSLPNIPLQ